MRLALEVPTSLMSRIMPLTDFNFALAQRVLGSEDYAREYWRRRNTLTILDNGFHERNLHPMEPVELRDAADRIGAQYTIAPDYLHDSKATYDGFKLMRKYFKDSQICVVLQGEDYPKRRDLMIALKREAPDLGMIALPYRAPRYATLENLVADKLTGWGPRFHLLGMNEPSELLSFRQLWEHGGHGTLTLDTAKPIKWGLQCQLIENLDDVHGGGLIDHEYDLEPTQAQWAYVYRNLAYLRMFM